MKFTSMSSDTRSFIETLQTYQRSTNPEVSASIAMAIAYDLRLMHSPCTDDVVMQEIRDTKVQVMNYLDALLSFVPIDYKTILDIYPGFYKTRVDMANSPTETLQIIFQKRLKYIPEAYLNKLNSYLNGQDNSPARQINFIYGFQSFLKDLESEKQSGIG